MFVSGLFQLGVLTVLKLSPRICNDNRSPILNERKTDKLISHEPGPAIATPPGGLPALEGVDVRAVLREKFGGPVDIVAYASTHREAAILKDGVLFVNPGSPTFPRGRPGRIQGQRALGTVGVLDVGGGVAVFEVIHLAEIASAAKQPAPAAAAPKM